MEDKLIELGLLGARDRKVPDTVGGLTVLFESLMALMSDMILPVAELDSGAFKTRLEEYRRKIVDTGSVEIDAAKECVADCEDYFHRWKTYGVEREAEFVAIIEMLHSALAQVAGESESFNDRLFVTADRIKRIADLNEVRDLKKMLAIEVRELRRMVVERQEQDERNQATLSKRVEELRSKLRVAKEEASNDPLTQIANRGAFDRTIGWLVEQRKHFVLAMLDIDHFKAINDTHGHRVGDNVILCATRWIVDNIRSSDIIARFGGDEFALLLLDTRLNECEERLARLVKDVASRRYVYMDKNTKREVKFTLSCGLAELSEGDLAEDVVQRADEALYDAKKQRSKVSIKLKST